MATRKITDPPQPKPSPRPRRKHQLTHPVDDATQHQQPKQLQDSPTKTPLSPYELTEVIDLDEVIGRGSYAVVKKLKFRGLECVGKKIHDTLYFNATPQQRTDMLKKFEEECELLSQLHHPCIVQFMGVYFEEGTPLPVLVMECLHSTLADAVGCYGVLPEQISYSILCDVSLGLRYLHEHNPPIIHRDLSANNVLLTTNMSAKISDLGVAKIINLSPTQMTQTTAPGTPCYMPPEALVARPRYDTNIDIYSIGVMMIHVFCGEWPFPAAPFQQDPQNPSSMIPVGEVERRAEFLQKVGDDHPLTLLIQRCLNNNPTLRPNAFQIQSQLARAQAHLPAMVKTRIEWIRELQQAQNETVAVINDVRERERKIETLKREKEDLEVLKKDREEKVASLRRRLEDASLKLKQYTDSAKPEIPSKLQWKRCADALTNLKMSRMNAVGIDELVYVGGGSNDGEAQVLQYSRAKNQVLCLPDHCSLSGFALCQFQGDLILVGGMSDDGEVSNKLYRYSFGEKKWVESLKPMPTARYCLSVLTTPQAIIACGGIKEDEFKKKEAVMVSTVEVYSSITSQWHTADPLPQACGTMSSVTANGWGYFLGGSDVTDTPIKSAYQVDMEMLIERATASTPETNTTSAWKTLHDTPLRASTAASLSGRLLAVGGVDDKNRAQSTTYVYVPLANSWVKISAGDLPAERYDSVAVQLSSNRLLIIGGVNKERKDTSTCFIGSIVDFCKMPE